MNQIEKRELTGKLQYDNTVILTYQIDYPVITKSRWNEGKEKFNEYNRQKAKRLEFYVITELFEEAKRTYEYNKNQGYPIMVYEVVVSYQITYNQSYFVSLYRDAYSYTGGAHGNTIRSSQNWNLLKGECIPLQRWYQDDCSCIIEILREINRQITERTKQEPGTYFDNFCGLVLESINLKNYYKVERGIVIFFEQYDIAPYSTGIPEFVILH